MDQLVEEASHYTHTINWSALIQLVTSKAITLIMVTLVFQLGRRLVKRFFESKFHQLLFKKSNSPQRMKTILNLTRNAVNYAFYFLYGYTVLAILGFPVSTLLAGAGIAGVAVGLGVKDFITDVVNGFFIILEGQYEVGEEVMIGDIRGTVKTVGIRTTIIQGANGNQYYIPNGDIAIVNNLNRENRRIIIELPITDKTQLAEFVSVIEQVTQMISTEYEADLTAEPTILGLVHQPLPSSKFYYQIAFYVVNGVQSRLSGQLYYRYLTELQKHDIHLLEG